MTIDRPLALLLLLLVPLAITAARRRLRRLPGRRGVVVAVVRCLLLALLVAALAQPALVQSYARLSVVFVVDAGAGVLPAQRAGARAWITRALQHLRPNDTAALLTFAGTPMTVAPLPVGDAARDPAAIPRGTWASMLALPPAAQAARTDIGAALHAALGLLASDGSGRIILLTNGQETTGDARAVAQLATAYHVGIVTVPLATARHRDASIARLDVPARTRQGGRLPVVVAVHSTYQTPAVLSVWSDGTLAGQETVHLTPGNASFSLDAVAGQPGLHTLTARVSAAGDNTPQNDALASPVVVGPPARVLVVASDQSGAAALVSTLRSRGFEDTVVNPGAMPATRQGFGRYDGVILDDVAAPSLRPAQVQALRSAVNDDAKGLVVVGGMHAFSLGRYTRTPLEDMLPVWSIPPARLSAGRLALMLVLDKSGSMDETQHGVTKMAMVREASTNTLSNLRPGDSLGVLAFDDTNHWMVPLHVVAGPNDKSHAARQIAKLTADGDTVIYPALQAAFAALSRTRAIARHIVLLTDGQGEEADFEGLIRRMRKAGVTLSTIAVGSDASTDQLRHWASIGGGRYYFTDDPHRIPSIFILETRLSGGPPTVEGMLGAHVFSDSPLLRSLVGLNLPLLNGYGMTIAKDDAQVVLESSLHDPVLAAWQFGLGRVVAWTPDWGPMWTSHWLALPVAARFWDDVVSWTLPPPRQSALHPAAVMNGADLLITASPRDSTGAPLDLLSGNLRVRVRGPGGLDTTLNLDQDAPGHYTAHLPAPRPGSYALDVTRDDGSVTIDHATIGAAVPYPAEYADEGTNMALLSDVARIAGGMVTADPTAAVAVAGTGPTPPIQHRTVALWGTCLLLGLLLLPLDVGLRILLNTPGAYKRE